MSELKEARAQLAAGDAQAAFQTIRAILQHPAPTLADQAPFVEAFGVFTEIARAIAGEPLAELIADVVDSPEDPDALYDAAYALYEQQLFGVATTLLFRANRLAPGQAKIVTELATNLEETMSYEEGRAVLQASDLVGKDPFVTYLVGFHGIMSGDIEEARNAVKALTGATGDLAFMRDSLDGMALRAEMLRAAKIDLGDHALSAWHAAVDGALLLHESPHGFDTPMRGRYAYVSDSPGLMRQGIARLAAVLQAESLSPTRVIAAPDPASQALARGASRVLGLPLATWSSAETEGLFVAWNMDAMGDVAFAEALREHHPGQILWAHASQWVDPFPYAADVTTYLGQQIVPPSLEDDIVNAPEAESQTPAELPLAIAKALRDLPPAHALGLRRTGENRRRGRKGSPVKSAYFT